ncbi:hypothetical protein CIB84_005054 [Bambusicola thoracicus]|uniref:Uncharacterized protein n=1 Tax=Bambusicola thoracicus TaxID=9083 RepID=A0A2P4T4A7_BAMTH|nr:hypothetical protein CIB84_005054 [Bambusicola thoracicus]
MPVSRMQIICGNTSKLALWKTHVDVLSVSKSSFMRQMCELMLVTGHTAIQSVTWVLFAQLIPGGNYEICIRNLKKSVNHTSVQHVAKVFVSLTCFPNTR